MTKTFRFQHKAAGVNEPTGGGVDAVPWPAGLLVQLSHNISFTAWQSVSSSGADLISDTSLTFLSFSPPP